jgi:hypothetical protein
MFSVFMAVVLEESVSATEDGKDLLVIDAVGDSSWILLLDSSLTDSQTIQQIYSVLG